MTTQVEKTIMVNVPVSRAYNQWTQFEDFPQFMGGVQSVTQLERRPSRVGCGDRWRPPPVGGQDP